MSDLHSRAFARSNITHPRCVASPPSNDGNPRSRLLCQAAARYSVLVSPSAPRRGKRVIARRIGRQDLFGRPLPTPRIIAVNRPDQLTPGENDNELHSAARCGYDVGRLSYCSSTAQETSTLAWVGARMSARVSKRSRGMDDKMAGGTMRSSESLTAAHGPTAIFSMA